MLTGKYWLMSGGVIDVTNSEHALYAKNYLLGLIDTKDQLVLTDRLFSPFTSREVAHYRKLGIPKPVLDYLKTVDEDGKTDPRIFVIREYGWIRVRGNGFYPWRFNRAAIETIRHAKVYWSLQSQVRNSDVVEIREIATFNNYLTTVSKLRKSGVAALLRLHPR